VARSVDTVYYPEPQFLRTPSSLPQLQPVLAREEAGTNYWGSAVRKWARTLLHVFVLLGSITIFRLYKLTLSDQAKVTLQLRVSVSDLV
jgi:hypothetical protein